MIVRSICGHFCSEHSIKQMCSEPDFTRKSENRKERDLADRQTGKGRNGREGESRKSNISGKNIRYRKNSGAGKNVTQLISRFWKMINERVPRPMLIGGAITVVLVLVIALSLGTRSGAEAAEVSAGQKDNINGFMFIFDRRSAQQRLVNDMEKGLVPQKLTCEKIEFKLEDDGTVVESIDESATIVTEDRDFITRVYQEMTDMIVIGQTAMRDNTTRCRITMELQDGTDCIFNFDTVSIIEIEGQDYMMESDGGLWKLLPGFF